MHKNRTPENPVCPSCETFLPDLSFVMQDFMFWIWKNYPHCHISEGFRDESTQHAYFIDGKSKVDYPESKHNTVESGRPFSHAVDLFVLDETGCAQFPIAFYQDVYSAALMASQPVVWGGSWTSFPDHDHFESET